MRRRNRASYANIVYCSLQSAAHKVRYWDLDWQKSLSLLLSARNIYTTRTVDELLFTGYRDNLLAMGKIMIDDPEIPAFDRFGWFYMVVVVNCLFFFNYVREDKKLSYKQYINIYIYTYSF